MKSYDYIICGAGCAGMSLLVRLSLDNFFAAKKILIIDADEKKKNDRTWCFWEKNEDIFEPIVFHQWKKLSFYSPQYASTFDLGSYKYKLIKGIDFYNFVRKKTTNNANIDWKTDVVKRVFDVNNAAFVELVSGEIFQAAYIFNSIILDKPKISSRDYHFLQHFKGWEIQTSTHQFDPSTAVFMDFRISQSNGTAFMYVLPTSNNTALVEYTLFSEKLLPENAYDEALSDYLVSRLKISTYKKLQEERGIIPMTTRKFPQREGRIIYIGIAGGQVKASTGYAFKFIQKRVVKIIESLKKNSINHSNTSFNNKKGGFYDAVLLHVLKNNKMEGGQIFASIFESNSPSEIFSFLDNESSVVNDLRIMKSVPIHIFLPAACFEFVKYCRNYMNN